MHDVDDAEKDPEHRCAVALHPASSLRHRLLLFEGVRPCTVRGDRRSPGPPFPAPVSHETPRGTALCDGGAGPGSARAVLRLSAHDRDARRQVAVGGSLLQEPDAGGGGVRRRQGGRQRPGGQAVAPGARRAIASRSRCPRVKRIVRVAALVRAAGPGAEAAMLYEDLTPPPPPREAAARAGGLSSARRRAGPPSASAAEIDRLSPVVERRARSARGRVQSRATGLDPSHRARLLRLSLSSSRCPGGPPGAGPREGGANPPRPRHCNRGRNPRSATGRAVRAGKAWGVGRSESQETCPDTATPNRSSREDPGDRSCTGRISSSAAPAAARAATPSRLGRRRLRGARGFVATRPGLDGDMRARIARHRAERPARVGHRRGAARRRRPPAARLARSVDRDRRRLPHGLGRQPPRPRA